jgi:hypothetical protein
MAKVRRRVTERQEPAQFLGLAGALLISSFSFLRH